MTLTVEVEELELLSELEVGVAVALPGTGVEVGVVEVGAGVEVGVLEVGVGVGVGDATTIPLVSVYVLLALVAQELSEYVIKLTS